MEKIFENFTISVLRLNKLVSKIKAYEMREFGLKSMHVMCIYYLGVNPEGITASELCKLTLEDKAAISRGLAQLAEKGYVTYDQNKYGAKIFLTESGKQLAAEVNEKCERAVKAGSVLKTEEELAFFYKALHGISNNLQEYYDSITKE